MFQLKERKGEEKKGKDRNVMDRKAHASIEYTGERNAHSNNEREDSMYALFNKIIKNYVSFFRVVFY